MLRKWFNVRWMMLNQQNCIIVSCIDQNKKNNQTESNTKSRNMYAKMKTKSLWPTFKVLFIARFFFGPSGSTMSSFSGLLCCAAPCFGWIVLYQDRFSSSLSEAFGVFDPCWRMCSTVDMKGLVFVTFIMNMKLKATSTTSRKTNSKPAQLRAQTLHIKCKVTQPWCSRIMSWKTPRPTKMQRKKNSEKVHPIKTH